MGDPAPSMTRAGGTLRFAGLATLSSWTALDVVIVVLLATAMVALLLWPRRRLTSRALDAEVRVAYAATFAADGCEIVKVSLLQIDAELFRLVMLIAPTAPRDIAGIDGLGATATLVGLNAMDRWPALASFEARVVCDASAALPSIQVAVLSRGHRRPADLHHDRRGRGGKHPVVRY